ncbi:MAG TPA: hypothetical protein VE397_12035 [Stellaceae bacterium]|nr:hypothetical protein [Stellaceae bacterium]
MELLPTPGIAAPTPTAAPPVVPVAGPTAPAAPMEPERRVTANREGGRGDLPAQQNLPKASSASRSRGRLLDLFV